MPVNCYLDAWNTGTSAIGTDKVTPESGNYGFTPVALMDWISGRTETSDTFGGQSVKSSVGVAASPTNRAAIGGQSQDAATTSSTDRAQRTDCTLITISHPTAGAIDGQFDLVSFDTNTITREPDDVMPASLRVLSLVMGGTDITNAEVLNWQDRLGAGAHTVNGFGFDPDLVIDIYLGLAAATGTATSTKTMSIAVCNLHTLDQWVFYGRTMDGQATPTSGGYFRSGEFVGCPATNPTTTTSVVIAAIDSKVTGGFTLNYSTADSPASGRQHYTLALKFASGASQIKVGTLDTVNDTVTDISIATSFTARGGLFVGRGKTMESSGVSTADDRLSLGGFSWDDTTLRQGCHFTGNDNTIDGSRDFTGVSHDQVYINGTNDAMTAEMRVTTVSSSAVTLRMTDAETATKVGYMLIGDPPAGSGHPAARRFGGFPHIARTKINGLRIW